MNKNYYKLILSLLVVGLIVLLGSCDPAKKYEKAEQESIDNFLASHSDLSFEKKSSGLYYLDVKIGAGRSPVLHDSAYVKLTGKFLDGTVFETNVGYADYAIPVGEGMALSGIDEGLTYMKEGGEATLLIPSKLACGSMGCYFISGYTPVIYEIVLDSIWKYPGK